MPQIKDVVDVNDIMNVVIYSDCTAEVQAGGERAFNRVVAVRKGPVVVMQKINEIVKRVWPIHGHRPEPDGEDRIEAACSSGSRQALHS